MAKENWLAFRNEIDTLIYDLGTTMLMTKQNGQTVRSNIVFIKSEAADIEVDSMTTLTGTKRGAVIPGGVRYAPEVGDDIIVEKVTHRITKVEAMKPATVLICYRLEVQS